MTSRYSAAEGGSLIIALSILKYDFIRHDSLLEYIWRRWSKAIREHYKWPGAKIQMYGTLVEDNFPFMNCELTNSLKHVKFAT